MDRPHSRSAQLITMACLACAGTFATLPAKGASPDKLSYGGQKDQAVGYQIEITADRQNEIDTLKGVVWYEYQSVSKEAIRLTYKGGLTRSSKAKPSSEYSPFGLPRFGSPFGRSRPYDPFSNMRFQGLTTTTNEICLSSMGEVESMEGDSQLPYLLGNASLLVFEPFPERSKQSWSVSTGISITEETRRSRFPYYASPFRTEEPKRITVGTEILTYQIRSVEGPIVIIDKTYRLDSPVVSQDVSAFEINGTGTWTFNSELGLSQSMEFKQKLIVQRGNTTVAFPMTISYSRMSQDELKTYQEEQQKRQEEARKRLAEMREKEATTPFTEQEIQKILDDLKSSNVGETITALQKLQKKKPKTSDPRIAIAVDALREHENQLVQQYVENTANNWPLPEGVLSVTAKRRDWLDSTGTFNVEAEFIELKGDMVHLRRSDGKDLEVPLDRLSQADQQAARELAEASKPLIANPFE